MKSRRRRGSVKKVKTLSQLLSRQPGPLIKHNLYGELVSHYKLSEPLQKLRISRRCYTLLNRAVITPENLVHFYKTYRLPKDPFFPLFLMIKRDYLFRKEEKAREKEEFILHEMKKLAPSRRRILRFLAEWEDSLNRKSEHPLWEESLYPGTKKRVRELLGFNDPEWNMMLKIHLEKLTSRYPLAKRRDTDLIAACLTLHLVPESDPLRPPSQDEIKRAYRTLCRLYHPDSGGESSHFISLGESRNTLLSLN